MILPAVQAVARHAAFTGDAWPDDLREAIQINGLDAEPFVEFAAQSVAPGFGAENTDPQRQRARIDPHALGDLGDVERIGGRRAEDVGAEVLQQCDLPLGHAAGHWYDSAA